jgi:exodeoxyribonuclease VII large subunit
VTVVPLRRELTVPELSNLVAGAIRGVPRNVAVRGQLVNVGQGYKGHLFACIAGGGVVIRCFIHARLVDRLPGSLAQGDTVVVHGRVGWYGLRGEVQVTADAVTLVDETTRALRAAAALKATLEREGLLRANRSLKMPELPHCLAVVGGHSSAAVLDIITAVHRRAPWVAIELHSARLQGTGAHLEIASAITAAAASGADVVAVVRGGGASGDFAPYDTAEVCRAIAQSCVPIVTALGHEQDRRLADMAAHTAASTPSDAARHIVPDASQLRVAAVSARRRMAASLARSLVGVESVRAAAATHLSASARLVTSHARARAQRASLDQRIATATAAAGVRHREARARFRHITEAITRRLSGSRESVARTREQNATSVRMRVATMRAVLDGLRQRVRASHPDSALSRGFVIARNRDGSLITRAEAAAAGGLQLQFSDGTVHVHVPTSQ